MTEIVSTKEIRKICSELRKGRIIIYPTETSYGIGCDATNQKAVRKIYQIKKRDRKKPLIAIVSDQKMAVKYFKLNDISITLIKKFSPGPLTLLCDRKKNSKIKTGESFRISSNRFVQKLVKAYGKPIASTSANIAGSPSLYKLKNLLIFRSKVHLIVNGGDLKKRKLSTVFDTRTLKVVRKGVISEKKILFVLKTRLQKFRSLQ